MKHLRKIQSLMHFFKGMLKLVVSFILYLLIFLVCLLLIYLNVRLFYQPTYTEGINKDVHYQLNYLGTMLEKGGGKLAQEKYPEGFIFLNVLYGLTWADFIAELPSTHPTRVLGLKKINWILDELDSQYARMNFPYALTPKRGIFYLGWKNYLLGQKLLLHAPLDPPSEQYEQFKEQSKQIYTAYKTSGKTYLESYKGLAWPADNVVAIASLRLYNQLDTPIYQNFVEEWLRQVEQHLDTTTGLIPHEVDFETGEVIEGAKGSSQSLMLNFLLDLDTTFARKQFEKYQKQFLDYRFGLPGIREYPKGKKGMEDVDSGPIILEIGGAASLVGQRTMALYNQTETAIGLRNCIESFGVAYTSNEEKRYVLGMEPIADAFIAWANVVPIQAAEKRVGNWRWTFQLLSLTILVFLAVICYKKKKHGFEE